MRLLKSSEQAMACHFSGQLDEVYKHSSVGGVLWSKKQLLSALRARELWGLFEQNKIAALAAVREDLFSLHIHYLATRPQMQKKGCMSKVFRYLTGMSQAKSKSIWLEVSHKNKRAQGLYLKFSFRQVGERVNYYKNGDNALLYTFDCQ